MGEDKDLEQLKKEAAAAAKAKAAERAKKKAQEVKEGGSSSDDIAKQKAAAAAKAKAAALAKRKAQETREGDAPSDDAAKQKAAAAAKAKAAALAKKKAQEGSGNDVDKAKAAAAAKAKAMAAAKAKRAGDTDSSSEKEAEKPSPNQPLLDRYVKIMKEQLGSDVIEEAYINRLSKDVPTLVIQKEAYYKVAQWFKTHHELHFEYLSELHGTDYETHMEVYVHLYSYKHHQPVALKVKIDRDQPEIDSLVPLWQGANWPECEAYDLLGIIFKGHPSLYRIMLGEDWIGYPLRKDYEAYDEEM